MQELEKAQEAASAANSVYRATLKAAKKAGVSSEAIVYALKCRHMDQDDLAAIEREKCRMLALSGIWPSIQTSLFDSYLPAPDLTAETTEEVAYDHGHTCGVKGENRDLNPHAPATDLWEAWDRGWVSGQGTNVAKMPSAKRGRPRKGDATPEVEADDKEPGPESGEKSPLFGD